MRETRLGALVQDYPNLEIIFSDDCSSDRTFEVVKELTQAYKGPHKLIFNRNHHNLGLMRHVNLCNQLATGDLIVVANDDDISLPDRLSKIVRAHQAPERRAHSIHSSAMRIDAAGQALEVWTPPLAEKNMGLPEMAQSLSVLIGATHAWTREVFDRFGPITQTQAYEDLLIAFRSALLGEIAYIDEPLVQYRVGHAGL